MRMRVARLALALLALAGCDEQVARTGSSRPQGSASTQTAEGAAPADSRTGAVAGAASVPRKIIYTAQIELIVEDFDRASRDVERLVREQGGYLAGADVRGSPGSRRQGTWTARVPVDRFGPFLEAIAGLGELQRRQSDAQDVTEEYLDLETRIKNKQVEEARLLKLLEEQTGELKDVLDVERELSRVREEVERQQGRLRYLANQTDLTTVTISVLERSGFVPAESPPFGTRLSRTFLASVEDLILFGEWLALAIVAAIPWLLATAVLALPIALWGWRHRAGRRSR